jgi:hypothetical protein
MISKEEELIIEDILLMKNIMLSKQMAKLSLNLRI